MRPVFALLVPLAFALACAGLEDAPGIEAYAPAASVETPPSPVDAPEAPADAPEAPATAAAPETPCDVGAFVIDPDPAGLNVRVAPRGQVVGQLPPGTAVSLVDAQNGWVQVRDAWHPDHDGDLPEGWVFAKLLGTSLKTPEEYGPDTRPMLLSAPAQGASSEPIDWRADPKVEVLGCQGSWLQVEVTARGQGRQGWLALDSHCPSLVTTCS